MESLESKLNDLLMRRDAVREEDRKLTEQIKKLRLDMYALAASQKKKSDDAASTATKEKSKEAAERRNRVFEMRSSGLTFTEIASRLGVSYGRARELFVNEERRRIYSAERAARKAAADIASTKEG